MIYRYAYINTHSTRGRPERIEIEPHHVACARVWWNVHCNPTYMLYLHDGQTLLCEDDYGCMNDLGHVPLQHVKRRHQL